MFFCLDRSRWEGAATNLSTRRKLPSQGWKQVSTAVKLEPGDGPSIGSLPEYDDIDKYLSEKESKSDKSWRKDGLSFDDAYSFSQTISTTNIPQEFCM